MDAQNSLSSYVLRLRREFFGFCAEKLRELELAPGLLYFVIYLGKHPGCSPGQLSAGVRADSGHTTRSVDKLVQSGFALREQNPDDRRAFRLTLTPKGETALGEIKGLFAQWDEEKMKDLTQEERSILLRILGRMASGSAGSYDGWSKEVTE